MIKDLSTLKFPATMLQPMEDWCERLLTEGALEKILTKLGISREQFEDPNFSINGDQFYYLFSSLRYLPKEIIPIRDMLDIYSWSSTGMLSVACMFSSSNEASILVAQKFSHVYMPAINYIFNKNSENSILRLEMAADFKEVSPHILECSLCFLYYMASEFMGEKPAITLHFESPNTLDMTDQEAALLYKEFLGCNVVFSSYFTGVNESNEFWQAPYNNINESVRNVALIELKKQKSELRAPRSIGFQAKKILTKAVDEHL